MSIIKRLEETNRVLVLLLLFLSFSYQTTSQKRWDSLLGGVGMPPYVMYADTIDNYLYAAGTWHIVNHEHMKGIGRWNGTSWDSMGAGIDGLDTLNADPDNTYAFARYNNKLYVCGVFSSLGNVRAICIGTWDGSTWDSLPIQPFTNNWRNAAEVMEVVNNKLYVGGIFDTVAGQPGVIGIAQWNDTSWSSLNFPNLKFFYNTSAICEYQGSVYVAGEFYNDLNDTISNMLRWDGKNWQSVGGGIKGSTVFIFNLVAYNGELYVGGYFNKSEGNVGDYIQCWDGTSWHDVGGGMGMGNGEVEDLFVHNNKLYAMGVFTIAGGIQASKIAEWNGTQWCGLGSKFDNTIDAGCFYKDTLYIGGGFWTIDGDSINYIAKWLGGNYVDTCGNDATAINEIKANPDSYRDDDVRVFPNPNNGTFTLSLSNISEKCNIEIYNILGEKVGDYLLDVNSEKMSITVNGLSEGIYLYNITVNNAIVKRDKMVIIK
jgi:hypothetical protein